MKLNLAIHSMIMQVITCNNFKNCTTQIKPSSAQEQWKLVISSVLRESSGENFAGHTEYFSYIYLVLFDSSSFADRSQSSERNAGKSRSEARRYQKNGEGEGNGGGNQAFFRHRLASISPG